MKKLFILILIGFLFVPYSYAFTRGADRYEIKLGSNIPFSAGVHLRYNWDTQYYTRLGAGFAVKWFMDTQQKMLNQMGFPTAKTMLLTSALTNSVVFSGRMGWAMSIYEGPYLELGYNLMLWGTGEATGDMIKNAINSSANVSNQNTVDILNHGPAVYAGYRFILIDKLTLNMELGAYKPLFAKTDINYGSGVAVPAGDSEKVNDLIFNHLWFLSAGLWFGLSF